MSVDLSYPAGWLFSPIIHTFGMSGFFWGHLIDKNIGTGEHHFWAQVTHGIATQFFANLPISEPSLVAGIKDGVRITLPFVGALFGSIERGQFQRAIEIAVYAGSTALSTRKFLEYCGLEVNDVYMTAATECFAYYLARGEERRIVTGP